MQKNNITKEVSIAEHKIADILLNGNIEIQIQIEATNQNQQLFHDERVYIKQAIKGKKNKYEKDNYTQDS